MNMHANPIRQSTRRSRWPARPALAFAVVVLLGFGLLYSLAGAGLGRLLFPQQATGSLVERDGQALGSALVAQPFGDARYFQPRPSAASYDPMAAAGSNHGAQQPGPAQAHRRSHRGGGAARRHRARRCARRTGHPVRWRSGPAPVARVARRCRSRASRRRVGSTSGRRRRLVDEHTEPPQFGLLGQPRVNVLRLNLALDALRQRMTSDHRPRERSRFLMRDSSDRRSP